MIKILNGIAKREKAKAIVTGDSLGQVASQTVENLQCIHSAADIPVFSPLIGLNKEEITSISKQIGTYELSIEPYPDCCSFMIAKHPETKADCEKIIKLEELILEKDALIDGAILKSELLKMNFS